MKMEQNTNNRNAGIWHSVLQSVDFQSPLSLIHPIADHCVKKFILLFSFDLEAKYHNTEKKIFFTHAVTIDFEKKLQWLEGLSSIIWLIIFGV